MFTWTKQFLAPPIFEDEDKTRIAGLLNIILLTTIAINVIYSPILAVILTKLGTGLGRITAKMGL